MAKQKTTTKSTKRYRYSSFKDKIDDLKIEPARNLDRRVHDDVETSHFLSSFEHWKDINLSGNFGSFMNEVEKLVQTLPQLLYHEEEIFTSLEQHIDKHDERSLQPLCDLLAQFCHDLGPDFMKFYERAVKSLISLLEAATEFENSNVFEWGFNCLAYVFKYLSRTLTQDLIPTFDLLFPLLSHRKEYLSRFSAEALSFLIRKAPQQNLESFVTFAFQKMCSLENDNFYDGLQTLFGEALKSTAEALHSRANIIFQILLKVAFETSSELVCVSQICDILLDITRYTSAENVQSLYELIVDFIDQNLNEDNADVGKSLRIITTLSFAESGRKVPSWDKLAGVLRKATQHAALDDSHADVVSFTFAIVLRNADVKTLTSLHKYMFELYLTKYSTHFIEFFKIAMDIDKAKLISFNGLKYLQKYVNSCWSDGAEKIALFLLETESSQDLNLKSHLSAPDFATQLLQDISGADVSSEQQIFSIYWKLIILKTLKQEDESVIVDILERVFQKETLSDFEKDFVGFLLQALTFQDATSSSAIAAKLLNILVPRIIQLQNSRYFVEGVSHVLAHLKEDTNIYESLNKILLPLTDNLLLPDRSIRYETLKLLISILEKQGNSVPQLFYDLRILEEIPLDLHTSRDLTLRIRQLGTDFSKMEAEDLLTNVFFKHIFGLLTVRFSPIWEAVYEIIPEVYTKNQSLVWSLAMRFLTVLDETKEVEYYHIANESELKEPFWTVSINRLNDSILASDRVFKKYSATGSSMLDVLEERRNSMVYPSLIRSQMFKVLLSIPSLAERHSRDIVPFLFNEEESEEVFVTEDQPTVELMTPTASKWTESDRNLLLKLIGKFKNIKSIYKSEEVHERLMVLLSSRTTEVQRLALDALFCYKDSHITKYRENLKNLLDDTLFKDEITKFLATDDTRTIQQQDEETVMTFIIRILFGRVQTPNTSGLKKSRKTAVITILPSLANRYIIQFLELATSKFKYEYFFENSNKIDSTYATSLTLRKMLGFINVINSSLAVLGSRYPDVMKTVIKPLVYAISMSNYIINEKLDEQFIEKVASNLRQIGYKCLYNLFSQLGEVLDWSPFTSDIFDNVITPRLEKFESENLQQPSSVMRIITNWAEQKSLYNFLYYKDLSAVSALLKTLQNSNAKESVVGVILNFCNKIINNPDKDPQYVSLIIMVVTACLQELPALLQRCTESTVISAAVDLLLNITELGYVEDNETRELLVGSLTHALQKDLSQFSVKDKAKILKTLSSLIDDFDCSFSQVEPLYVAASKLYRSYSDKDLRQALNTVFVSIGTRFNEYEAVATLLSDLNSYSTNRMREYDFERRLPAFKRFAEVECASYTGLQWLPVLYSCLFFINDTIELAIRTNASHTLYRFVDCMNSKASVEEAADFIEYMKTIILPNVKTGLRKNVEEVQNEYISLIAYIVTHSENLPEIEDMKVLLHNGDEEADFFVNINHIQLHRRQRAVRRLKEYASKLSDNSISHYLIPMIERYVFSNEEKYRNIGNETMVTIGSLSNYMSWNQYKALFRRYSFMLKKNAEKQKEIVSLIVNISVSLKNSLQATRTGNESQPKIRKFPENLENPESFITKDVFPGLSKILSTRDDETIVSRIHLSEALVNLALGLEKNETASLLPGILTSVCQVLRSRSEELREAVRKNLANLATILGPKYLSFIIKELKAALTRGSQIHVLSYSLHFVLMSISEVLVHGDLDDSVGMIVSVIMEDIFGAAGQEKDAEGYTSKMKEVKFNKSFDTGELVTSNITLPMFGSLLRPINVLLHERLALKSQNKLNELLRRYALGLNHNEESASPDVLRLCYEIFDQSHSDNTRKRHANLKTAKDERAEFFLVDLNFKSGVVQNDNAIYVDTLQRFSLDLLRTAVTKNANLMEVKYLQAFIPLMKETLVSENEGVVMSTLRLLTIIIKLDFEEESEAIFKNCARKVLEIVKNSPSTSSDLCQMGLKFLSVMLRHKDIQLKDTALGYLLGRIQPDLMEPSKQGLAFNFVKALLSKHIMLPELYDVVDNIAEIMVTNHSKEIRDVARGVYYHFLMEYDQSKGRLEKQFRFMLDNLHYPSREGRQSVLELVNLVIKKSGMEIVKKISSSFFVSLANVYVQDDAPTCREMASVLLASLFEKLGKENTGEIEKFITAWLKQPDSEQFIGLGLKIYKIYLSKLGTGINESLDSLAITRVKFVISNTDIGSDSSWDLVYTALSVFSVYVSKNEAEAFSSEFDDMWKQIASCLLYPHSWVRLLAVRLTNQLMNNLSKLETPLDDYQIQTIAYRLFRLLGAPNLPENLSSVAVKTLLVIIMRWNENNAPYIHNSEENTVSRYSDAIEFVISRTGWIIRSEDNPNDSHNSKKAAIQLAALVMQILSNDRLSKEAEKFIMPLYMYIETNVYSLDENQEELHNLAQECIKILESKISVSDFTSAYANVKQQVIKRRQERRAKRAVLAVRAPDVAANRKLKKHARSREKRKHEKDENGFYQRKNKKRRAP
ncbi:unnamed protein product [Kluyveromyces dobzhanskii CBS 2104]|uniref:WGS project CCBQ000000000 data, contig 00008 n=1 Tax=Kluyveromyces dobzhanskii CBS 2104 TaxID=1427455 RepID=A0A0A8L9J6_9SACH|nr:unnamed protein product [Kluyveromyces dobzhanskii CBS 2104]